MSLSPWRMIVSILAVPFVTTITATQEKATLPPPTHQDVQYGPLENR
jgi:hypothetical protein